LALLPIILRLFLIPSPPPITPLFPYTPLFRSPVPPSFRPLTRQTSHPPSTPPATRAPPTPRAPPARQRPATPTARQRPGSPRARSEEHTSELQSRFDLVCRLLLEKKKNTAHEH